MISPTDAPSELLKQLYQAGVETKKRLEQDSYSWICRFESRMQLYELQSFVMPGRRWTQMWIEAQGQKHLILTMIEMDGYWYLSTMEGNFRYRPFEGVVPFVAFYVLRQNSLPMTLSEPAIDAKYVDTVNGVAHFRSDLPDDLTAELQFTLQQLEQGDPTGSSPQTIQMRAQVMQMIESGVATQINVESGIITQRGAPSRRIATSNPAWGASPDPRMFSIDSIEWEDRTSSLIASEASRNQLITAEVEPRWQMGRPHGDGNRVLLNIETGETRRLPLAHGQPLSGVLSHCRTKAYIPQLLGDYLQHSNFVPVELDLETGEAKNLGSPELLSGRASWMALSSDGTKLAIRYDKDPANMDHPRLYVIDLASGETQQVGDVDVQAYLSWLDDGSGVIFAKEKYVRPDLQPTIEIARIDMSGEFTILREGMMPVVIPKANRILFKKFEGMLWHTCDLKGGDVKLFADGLPGAIQLSVMPEGDRVVAVRELAEQEPKLQVIDLETGDATDIPAGPGYWRDPQC